MNLKDLKLDIIILAGQSNAEGCGLGETQNEYALNPDILMMSDTYPVGYKKDEGGVEYLDVKRPTKFTVKTACENISNGQKIGNFALVFAREYAKNDLEKNRKVLIVNAAVGGTGFSRCQWGVSNPLHNRLTDMIKEALGYNSENRIVAFLWHQGESDALENKDMPLKEIQSRYFDHFSNMIKNLDDLYDFKKVPLISAGFCNEWASKFSEQCKAVISALVSFCKNHKNSAFFETDDLESNNQSIGNGDDIHFSRKSLYVLGERYYKAYKSIKGIHTAR